MRVSIIVTTYNRPLALARVLDALRDQFVLPHEVIVADDGSGAPTLDLMRASRSTFPVPLRHAWQPDQGFRAAAVRNLAAAQATGDWLHFLDGDCVPRRSLVARIIGLARPGEMLAGDRILLNESFTRRVEGEGIPIHRWRMRQWFAARRRGDINRLQPLVWWPFAAGRHWQSRRWESFRSANVGVMREAFNRLGGFEAAMVGWGLEDSEFAVRAVGQGMRITSGRLALGVFHLWHRERPRDDLARNEAFLNKALDARH